MHRITTFDDFFERLSFMQAKRKIILFFLLPFLLFIQGSRFFQPETNICAGIYENALSPSFVDDEAVSQGFVIDTLHEATLQESCEFKECLAVLEWGEIDPAGLIGYSWEGSKRFDLSLEILLINRRQVYIPHGEAVIPILGFGGQHLALRIADQNDLLQSATVFNPVAVTKGESQRC